MDLSYLPGEGNQIPDDGKSTSVSLEHDILWLSSKSASLSWSRMFVFYFPAYL